ncbi:transporter [Acinetobacter lanii]|uniref:Transporter n=1 Tax=Acinetobacter lanii TaxID=2715163 RepID=A0A6G8S0N6_9GAMM|nr:transporter [Acinetobacter lanii]QIO07691.1 transporter [Acinetobacter lanii]
MTKLKQLGVMCIACMGMQAMAADFSFDRPGTGFSTGITPVGKLAWEQALPTASYTESSAEDGAKVKTWNLNADMLFRTGIGKNTELQLGWQGPAWTQSKVHGHSTDDDGVGDITVGIKHAIDLQDEKLTWAVLAQALIATGDGQFTEDEEIYTLGSSVDYAFNDTVNTGISMFYEVQDGDWAITAVPTLGYKIKGNLSGYSELVYRKQEHQDNEYALGTGLIYALNDRVQFDASVGVNLEGQDKSYKGGLGAAFLF